MNQTYLAILADTEGNPDYFHPSEINASSKQEVKQLLSENTPPEFIINIFTIQEYRDFINSRQFKQANALTQGSNTEDGNLFLNNMIETATQYAQEAEQHNIQSQKPIINVPTNPIEQQNIQQPDLTIKTLEFEDNGIKYKVENNHMYKKVWRTVVIDTNTQPVDETVIDGKGEFRIINNKTNKEIDYTKYSLQKLDWQLVK